MMRKNLILVPILVLLGSCDMASKLEHRAEVMTNYRNSALSLAKQNRHQRAQINSLKFDLQAMKAKNNYLKIQLEKNKSPAMAKAPEVVKADRQPASIPTDVPKDDLVKFSVYKWTPTQVLSMAEKEFDRKNFEKSAQFFQAFSSNFPGHKKIDDHYLFQAGVASFESGAHHDWTIRHLEALVKGYPASKFYRGAKLWMGLTYLKTGNQDKFFATVEEFRMKYRNTPEWKILSQHYEKIVQKYKKN